MNFFLDDIRWNQSFTSRPLEWCQNQKPGKTLQDMYFTQHQLESIPLE